MLKQGERPLISQTFSPLFYSPSKLAFIWVLHYTFLTNMTNSMKVCIKMQNFIQDAKLTHSKTNNRWLLPGSKKLFAILEKDGEKNNI